MLATVVQWAPNIWRITLWGAIIIWGWPLWLGFVCGVWECRSDKLRFVYCFCFSLLIVCAGTDIIISHPIISDDQIFINHHFQLALHPCPLLPNNHICFSWTDVHALLNRLLSCFPPPLCVCSITHSTLGLNSGSSLQICCSMWLFGPPHGLVKISIEDRQVCIGLESLESTQFDFTRGWFRLSHVTHKGQFFLFGLLLRCRDLVLNSICSQPR